MQLIFGLLNCSFDDTKKDFVENILKDFDIEDKISKNFAKIEIIMNKEEYNFNFFVVKDTFLPDKNASFSVFEKNKNLQNEILLKVKKIDEIAKPLNKLYSLLSQDGKFKKNNPNDFTEIADKTCANNKFSDELQRKLRKNRREPEFFFSILKNEFNLLSNEHSNLIQKYDNLAKAENLFNAFLQTKNYTYSFTFKSEKTNENLTLLYKSNLFGKEGEKKILKQISEKIYLSAPYTQIHHLLPLETRKLLFKKSNSGNKNYYSELEKAKKRLTNFFTYDFFSTDLLIELLANARDNDFEELNKNGSYGDSYKKLIKELNSVLTNKKIVTNKDLTEISFKQEDTDIIQEIQI